jgi:guanylate cyclase
VPAPPPWLDRLISLQVLPGDDEETVERKRLLAGGGLFAPFALVMVGVIYLVFGATVAGVAYCAFAAWIWLCVAASTRHHNYHWAFWSVAIPALPTHLVVILSLGDMVHSGAIVLWGLAFPLATGLVFTTARAMAPLFVLFAVNVAATVLAPDRHTGLSRDVLRTVLALNIVTQAVFAVAILALFVSQRDRAHRLLAAEQARSRALLLSILPEQIADELAVAPRVIADHFDEVSVLFADVVGFTPMSAAMTPAELVELLDELFARFDALIEQAGLEKIKTIGDCYMVAAGVPRPRPDHAAALVRLALQMQEVASSQAFRGRRLELRIGVNSGSVVAGVIGRRKFSYDLWGDVVNTASRMESHGVPGAVQITAATRSRLDGAFECTERGEIDVRGKGRLPVFVVSAAGRPAPAPPR